jgi:uncharacterized protein (DUF58 family)
LTRRGRLALALGFGVYAVAWLLGSKPLYPVAVGLVGAAVLGLVWIRVAARPVTVSRRTAPDEQVEGGDVDVEIEVELEPGVRPAGLVLREHVGRLGVLRAPLELSGRRARGRYTLRGVPRGRYAFTDGEVVLEDPFALARTGAALPATGALLVHPRLVELDAVFSEAGGHGDQGRRLLLRRPAGFELHGVREYQDGESLRRVHWPSTAKRGQLMVKDLEDAPRDELAVLLDAQAGATVGGSFDVQVRAAGSILRSFARRGRRAALIVNSASPVVRRVSSFESDWGAAYDALAAAEADGATPLAGLLAAESGAARALELIVVTAVLPRALVDRLCQRAAGNRRTALVLVDAASFGRGSASPRPELLRLAAAGVAVAVVRQGDDLAAVLGGPPAEVAHG